MNPQPMPLAPHGFCYRCAKRGEWVAIEKTGDHPITAAPRVACPKCKPRGNR
jgi:hypothetical protein